MNMLKMKKIDKRNIDKANTINSSIQVKPRKHNLRSEKQGKISMNLVTMNYTQRNTRKGLEKINCNERHKD